MSGHSVVGSRRDWLRLIGLSDRAPPRTYSSVLGCWLSGDIAFQISAYPLEHQQRVLPFPVTVCF